MQKLDRNKLDFALARKCYTLLDLSKKSGVCYSSLIKLSNEQMRLTTRTLGKIANALDIKPESIVQDETPARK